MLSIERLFNINFVNFWDTKTYLSTRKKTSLVKLLG